MVSTVLVKSSVRFNGSPERKLNKYFEKERDVIKKAICSSRHYRYTKIRYDGSVFMGFRNTFAKFSTRRRLVDTSQIKVRLQRIS